MSKSIKKSSGSKSRRHLHKILRAVKKELRSQELLWTIEEIRICQGKYLEMVSMSINVKIKEETPVMAGRLVRDILMGKFLEDLLIKLYKEHGIGGVLVNIDTEDTHCGALKEAKSVVWKNK